MTTFVFILIGIIIGAGMVILTLYERLPGLMFKESLSKYSFEQTEQELTKVIEARGWKMPAVHDLQQTMENNGIKVLQVKVFEICKPNLAHEILKRDDERVVASMMPCRIAIYTRTNGKTYVSRMNAGLMSRPMPGVVPKVMKQAADEVEQMLSQFS